MDEFSAANRVTWDDRAPVHAASVFYGLDRFEDPAFLSEVVRFDLPRLGEIAGLDGVHLQCHIGSDTVSLARLGARMTGLDFSPAALIQARLLASRAGAQIEFVESDVYDAIAALGHRSFDLVFTGIGALCWLPDIDRWAGVVAALLRPGGRLFLRDAHPVLDAIGEDRPDGVLALEHAYGQQIEPVAWVSDGTYTDTPGALPTRTSYQWNHGLGEVVSAVLGAGLTLTGLEEHDSAPWNALPGRMTQVELGEWRLTDRPWRLPHTFTLQASKPT